MINSLTQLAIDSNPLIALIADGIHYNEEIKEYEIWLNGKAVAWARDYNTAERSYFEMLRVERDHARRNRANVIPFQGEPFDNDSSETARLGLGPEW